MNNRAYWSQINTNKKRASFYTCLVIIGWLISAYLFEPVVYRSLVFIPPVSPEKAVVTCYYDQVYTRIEDYQFRIKHSEGYHCCESRHDSAYNKIISTKMIVIMRKIQCEHDLSVDYKVDILNMDSKEEVIHETMNKIKEKFPQNKSISYWYYPTLVWLKYENYLIDEPLIADEDFYILYLIISFLSASIFFMPLIVYVSSIRHYE